MPEKISIVKDSGETLNSNIVSVFLIPDSQKKYIITTENSVDSHGLTVLHVSEIVDGTLQKVATDEEWSSIKTIMRAIISGNVGTFKYLQGMESAKVSGQYSRDISVSASASKQMIDNYTNAEKMPLSGEETAAEASSEGGETNSVPTNTDANTPNNNTVQPSTIFPAETQVASDNEVVPGIAEVPSASTQEPASTVSQPVAPAAIDNGVTAPVVDNQALGQPVMQQAIDVNSGLPMAGGTPFVPNAPMLNSQGVVNTFNIDRTAVPSFSPNATLDEVVMASQEMFMEGVKNLVQTIQEKVYRDLYAKEAELKNREALIEQREMLVNNQLMMNMNTNQLMMNQSMMNGMQAVSPISMVPDPNMQMAGVVNTSMMQPMIGQTINQMGMNMQQMPVNNTPMMNNPQAMTSMPQGPTIVSAGNDVV